GEERRSEGACPRRRGPTRGPTDRGGKGRPRLRGLGTARTTVRDGDGGVPSADESLRPTREKAEGRHRGDRSRANRDESNLEEPRSGTRARLPQGRDDRSTRCADACEGTRSPRRGKGEGA